MAYDSVRATSVMFGGQGPLAGDTWEWDGEAWNLMSLSGPSARFGHAMAFDAASQVTVLFGGSQTANTFDGQTWKWDGESWTLASTSGPAPRRDHAIAYDSARQSTVLFGGLTAPLSYSDETWEWDGYAWTPHDVAGPSERTGHAMAYDAARGVTVLFGGNAGTGVTFGDTWEWDGEVWTLRTTSGPAPRYKHVMIYDSAAQATLLFGGFAGAAYSNETWTWNGTAWTLITSVNPSPRYRHAAAYDVARDAVVLFGGSLGPGTPNMADTWERKIAPPEIPQQISEHHTFVGQITSFGIVAISAGVTTYQWQRNGMILANGMGISGVTTPTLTFSPASFSHEGFYDVTVGNGCGMIVSDPIVLDVRLVGDWNDDGHVALDDAAALAGCTSNPNQLPSPPPPALPSDCTIAFDQLHDNDVDLRDIAAFQRGFTGP